jgi:hypothetical protein
MKDLHGPQTAGRSPRRGEIGISGEHDEAYTPKQTYVCPLHRKPAHAGARGQTSRSRGSFLASAPTSECSEPATWAPGVREGAGASRAPHMRAPTPPENGPRGLPPLPSVPEQV